jgi:hypothetical protein
LDEQLCVPLVVAGVVDDLKGREIRLDLAEFRLCSVVAAARANLLGVLGVGL